MTVERRSGNRADLPPGHPTQRRRQPVARLDLDGDALVRDGEAIQRDLNAPVRWWCGHHWRSR
ncbi:hypothetical protein [Streptosporangium sp. NPDC049046]|uniref:hypothetical protein n=1 Tax=Streptosporangium sp. NPDC049046 TaxID=3155031 RepID=UPI00342F1B12